MEKNTTVIDAQTLNRVGAPYLPGFIGIEVVSIEPEAIVCRLEVRNELLAPNGYLHAAAVVALADTACGYGTMCRLPEGASGFTTIELKSNFTGTARAGTLVCRALAVHRGKLTQVWDAVVTHEDTGKTVAHFRCTQMLLLQSLNDCTT
ncbi:MAG: PaaI family thioesterase [Desulfobacterales bacterium]